MDYTLSQNVSPSVHFSASDVTRDLKHVYMKGFRAVGNEAINVMFSLEDEAKCSFLVGRSYVELIANLLFKTGKFLKKNENNLFIEAAKHSQDIFSWTFSCHLKDVKYIVFTDCIQFDNDTLISKMILKTLESLQKKGMLKNMKIHNLPELCSVLTHGFLIIPYSMPREKGCIDHEQLELNALTCPLIINILRYSVDSIKVATLGENSTFCLEKAYLKLQDNVMGSCTAFHHSMRVIKKSADLTQFFLDSSIDFDVF